MEGYLPCGPFSRTIFTSNIRWFDVIVGPIALSGKLRCRSQRHYAVSEAGGKKMIRGKLKAPISNWADTSHIRRCSASFGLTVRPLCVFLVVGVGFIY